MGFRIKISLVKPSSRPLAMARPDAAHGNTAFFDLDAVALGDFFGDAHPATSGRCRPRPESPARRSNGFWPAPFRRHYALVYALCASIGWPTMSPMA